MEYNFCNADNDLLNKITLTLSNLLFNETPSEIIVERYVEMIDNFNKPVDSWPKKISYKYASCGDMAVPICNINGVDLSTAKNIGIDLPTWFNFLNGQTKIMLVGMEPLRLYDFFNHATVSSPFGLHHYNDKKNPSRNLVYKFIRQLVESRFSVYLTDISKIYYVKNNNKCVGSSEINNQIFCDELKHVVLSYILTFGKTAFRKVESFFEMNTNSCTAQVIQLAHPAGRNGPKNYYEYFKTMAEI